MNNLPNIDSCEECTYAYEVIDKHGYKHNNKRVYKPKNPYNKHKKYVNEIIKNMTNEEFKEFFKSINWTKYEH